MAIAFMSGPCVDPCGSSPESWFSRQLVGVPALWKMINGMLSCGDVVEDWALFKRIAAINQASPLCLFCTHGRRSRTDLEGCPADSCKNCQNFQWLRGKGLVLMGVDMPARIERARVDSREQSYLVVATIERVYKN